MKLPYSAIFLNFVRLKKTINHMNRTEIALLSLLQAGLWTREPDCKELFPLTGDEWTEVFRRSKEQTVSALVLQGINQLSEEQMPSLPLLQQWAVNVDSIENCNRKQNKVQEEVIEWLKGLGIHPKVLKGQGAAALYEEPLLRACGDIDLFFPTPGDHKKARKALKDKGLNLKEGIYGAFVTKWDGVTVEFHQRLLDISNPFCKNTIAELIEQEARTEGIYPTPLTTLLLLNTHILKHLLGNGIGLRQLADMARAYHRLNGQYDKLEYQRLCKRLKIENWTREMNSFLVEHIGLSPEDLPSFDSAQAQSTQEGNNTQRSFIYRKVMAGGNFGYYGPRKAVENAPRPIRRLWTLASIIKSWKHSLRLAPYESFFIIFIYTFSKGKQ